MATQKLLLTSNWQFVSGGPVTVQLRYGTYAEVHVAASPPANTEDAAHIIYERVNADSFAYNGTDNVYGRSNDPRATLIYTG